MCPLFYKQVTRKLAPKLAVILTNLVRADSFPACCRSADIVPVPNRSASSDVGDYRPIYITSVLSKVFEKIVAENLSLRR